MVNRQGIYLIPVNIYLIPVNRQGIYLIPDPGPHVHHFTDERICKAEGKTPNKRWRYYTIKRCTCGATQGNP